jgi:hypothetical protein
MRFSSARSVPPSQFLGKLGTALLGLSLAMPTAATAQTANFDALPTGSFRDVPLGYVSHNWFYGLGTFGTGNLLQYSTLNADCRSAPNCAYNANGNTEIRIESLTPDAADAFTFQGYLASGYPGFGTGATSVRAQGFVGTSSTAAYDVTTNLLPGGGFSLFSSLIGVNRLILTPMTTGVAGTSGYVRLDDVTFGTAAPMTPSPEPASIALMATGLLVIGSAAVRRKRTT